MDKLDLTTGRRLPWKQLLPTDLAGVTSIRWIGVSRDGGSYAYSYSRVTSSDLYVVDGFAGKAPVTREGEPETKFCGLAPTLRGVRYLRVAP